MIELGQAIYDALPQLSHNLAAPTLGSRVRGLFGRTSHERSDSYTHDRPALRLPREQRALREARVDAERMVLAGAGDTLLAMCRQARAADIGVIALSPDRELQAPLAAIGVALHVLLAQHALPPLPLDPYTAAITLFHDHDWELPFLQQALASDACLVGAMGSPRAQALRLEQLQARGVPAPALARLRSPLGLLPRARDPQELAVSILAEAMQAYRERCHPEPAHRA